MAIVKKIFFAVLSFAIASVAFAKGDSPEQLSSLFSQVFARTTFFNAKQVLDAYTGNWSGMQSIAVDGREVASALVEQKYIPTEASRARLIGSGKITGMGSSIPIRSIMYIDSFGNLCLDIKTQSSESVEYLGFFDSNKVTWVPKHFFMLYDSQVDEFFYSSDGMRMRSNGVKFVVIKQNNFEGFIEVNCELRRAKSAYSADKVNKTSSSKISFPNVKMVD